MVSTSVGWAAIYLQPGPYLLHLPQSSGPRLALKYSNISGSCCQFNHWTKMEDIADSAYRWRFPMFFASFWSKVVFDTCCFVCLLVVIIQGNLDRYSGKFGTRRSGVRRGSGGSVPGRLFWEVIEVMQWKVLDLRGRINRTLLLLLLLMVQRSQTTTGWMYKTL